MGDVEGVEVCGELERGGHQADKAGQEQQVDKHNNNNNNKEKLQQSSCKHDKVPGQDRGQC